MNTKSITAAQKTHRARSAAKVLSPLRIFILTLSVYLLGLLIIPIDIKITPSIESICFFILLILGAGFGLTIGSVRRSNAAAIQSNFARIDWLTAARRCIALGTIGVVLAIVDRYVIRGVDISANLFEARTTIEDNKGGPFAVLAAFLASFAAFGVILVMLARANGQPAKRFTKVLASINLIAYIGLSILLGSRSLLLVAGLLHFFPWLFIRKWQGKPLNLRVIAIWLSIVFAFIVALIVIMLYRIDLMELSVIDTLQYSAYAFTIGPPDDLVSVLHGSLLLETFGAAVYSLILYIYHGLFEFCLLFNDYQGGHTLGQQLFWLPIKTLSIIFSFAPPPDLVEFAGYRSGIFTTFAEPFFIDFGLFAPVAAFLFLALLCIPYRQVISGDMRWLLPCFQVLVVMIFAPIMPLLQSAVGTYLLVASIVLVFVTPLKPKNTKTKPR